MKKLILILLLLVITSGLAAKDDIGNDSPFAFGMGARELSLAGSAIANADPATASFWNPSALGLAQKFSLTGFHVRLFEPGISYDYIGITAPSLDLGTFGFGIFRQGIDGINKRDANNLSLGEISNTQLRMYFAYGRKFQNYNLGINLSLDYQSIDIYKSWSTPGLGLSASKRFTFDSSWLKSVSIAIKGDNLLSPGIKLAEESFKYPPSLTFGTAVQVIPKSNGFHTITFSTSLKKTDFTAIRLATGLEYELKQLLSLRLGYRESGLSGGIGLQHSGFKFDYSVTNKDLGLLHMFSLTMSFGNSISQRRILRQARIENEFNRVMSSNIKDRNKTTIDNLFKQGWKAKESGELKEAEDSFDRALFIAGSIDIDTTEIHNLLLEVRSMITSATSDIKLKGFIDSAEVAKNSGDYLFSRHYAQLALNEEPTHEKALDIIKWADSCVAQIGAVEDQITITIKAVDSLYLIGRTDQAMTLIQSLKVQYPENEIVTLTLGRMQIDRWRRMALTASNHNDMSVTLEALDSISALFPGYVPESFEVDLPKKDLLEGAVASIESTVIDIPKPITVTPLLRQEAQRAYSEGKNAFKQGELEKAIEFWETVERIIPGYESTHEYLVKALRLVGVELYGQRKRLEAVKVWKRAAEIDPDNQEIYEYLKRTENEMRRLKELSDGSR